MRYEITDKGKATLIDNLLDSLVTTGYLRKLDEVKVEYHVNKVPATLPPNSGSVLKAPLKIEEQDNTPCNQYIGNHLPIETNIESIARDILGVVEDRKLWVKELKEAVKTHGHDDVLESFYQWAQGWAGSFLGKKPVTFFLKNIDNNIGTTRKPTVTNPSLDRVSTRIAYISDNKVFFTGDFRIRLASLIREHGEDLVVKAFEDFFQDVDERGLTWAGRDFLQRAHVMILTIKQKHSETEAAKQLLQSSYDAAKSAVEELEEDEPEEL